MQLFDIFDNMNFIAVICFSLSVLLTACNAKSNVNNNTEAQQISQTSFIPETQIVKITAKGEIIPSVPVYSSPGDSFSLYLPAQFDTAKATPVMLFFDPHGESEMVLGRYKKLADKYGYVIACSKKYINHSSSAEGVTAANALLSDLLLRFNVDKSKIIFAGFSGGAKIAIDAACGNPEVDAVVYSGSVALWSNLNHSVQFLGIAGKEDMNYTQLISFNQSEYLKGKPHYLIEWNGKHEWPDEKVFAYAFQYPFGNIPADKLFEFDEKFKEKFQREQQLGQAYYNALSAQDLNWWRTEARDMRAKAKDDIMYRRLLGLVSLSCYSYSQKLLAANDLANAEKIITIYEWVDPDNKDCAAFKSDLQKRKSNR